MNLIKTHLWIRALLLFAVVALCVAGGAYGYRLFTKPVPLTVAVGSIDGEAVRAMGAIAKKLSDDGGGERLQIVDAGTPDGAAKMFADGKVDLAVIRGDSSAAPNAQAVVVLARLVALMMVPPGSPIDSMEKLRGRTVGVLGGPTNTRLVEALSKQYDLPNSKINFKFLGVQDARQALQARQIQAVLAVIPLTGKYLSQVKSLFPQNPKNPPTVLSIDAAGAISDDVPAFENFDLPKGSVRGSPALPDDDLNTVRVSLYVVSQKKVHTRVITDLTETIMKARRELLTEQPIFAQITAPSTDPDAPLPLHPGAAAFYNGTEVSYMDQYGDYIYLVPMVLGAIATVLGAAWKFLGIGNPPYIEGPLDTLYGLARRIRAVDTEDDLLEIEGKIDDVLKEQWALTAKGDEDAVDAGTLNVIAHRLENLIHDRRQLLTEQKGRTKVSDRAAEAAATG